jgi:hypothetical protein
MKENSVLSLVILLSSTKVESSNCIGDLSSHLHLFKNTSSRSCNERGIGMNENSVSSVRLGTGQVTSTFSSPSLFK